MHPSGIGTAWNPCICPCTAETFEMCDCPGHGEVTCVPTEEPPTAVGGNDLIERTHRVTGVDVTVDPLEYLGEQIDDVCPGKVGNEGSRV